MIFWSKYSWGDVCGLFRFTSESVRALGLQDGWFEADIEKILSSDVSAKSVMVYFVCGYCTSGTSENVLRLIN